FRAKTHDLLLGHTFAVSDGGCCADRLVVIRVHGGLEAANAFSDSFAELGKLLRSKHEKRNSENHQQMGRLKQSFKHECSFSSNGKQCGWQIVVKMRTPFHDPYSVRQERNTKKRTVRAQVTSEPRHR